MRNVVMRRLGKEGMSNLRTYWNHSDFPSVLKQVQKDFLDMTAMKSVSGKPYVVLCLLFIHAIQKLIAFEAGKDVDECLLHEAVAIAVYVTSVKPRSVTPNRYYTLVTTMMDLQRHDETFNKLIDAFLTWDETEGRRP